MCENFEKMGVKFNELINPGLTKQLKELGYDWKKSDPDHHEDCYMMVGDDMIIVPTLCDVQEWLRIRHEMYVSVEWCADTISPWQWKITGPNLKSKFISGLGSISYEQTLNNAIFAAIIELKNMNKYEKEV